MNAHFYGLFYISYFLFLFLQKWIVGDFVLAFYGSCIVHVEAVLGRGEVVCRVVVVCLCIPDAGDGVEGEVVGEDLVFMGFQCLHEARVGCLVGWREVDE